MVQVMHNTPMRDAFIKADPTMIKRKQGIIRHHPRGWTINLKAATYRKLIHAGIITQ